VQSLRVPQRTPAGAHHCAVGEHDESRKAGLRCFLPGRSANNLLCWSELGLDKNLLPRYARRYNRCRDPLLIAIHLPHAVETRKLAPRIITLHIGLTGNFLLLLRIDEGRRADTVGGLLTDAVSMARIPLRSEAWMHSSSPSRTWYVPYTTDGSQVWVA